MTKDLENGIRKEAAILNDVDLIGRIVDVDFIAQEVRYHRLCRNRYHEKARLCVKLKSKTTLKPGLWTKSRSAHKAAFLNICEYINSNILIREEVLGFKNVKNRYIRLVIDNGGQRDSITGFKIQHLERKLIAHFGEKVKIISNGKAGKIIHKAEMNSEEAIKSFFDNNREVRIIFLKVVISTT